MTWELGAILGGSGLLTALGAVIYALVSVRASHKDVAAYGVEASKRRDERDVERRLRQQAEVERDRALAEVERLKVDLAAEVAAHAQARAERDDAAVAEMKEQIDAATDGTLDDATRVLGDVLRK